MPAKRMERWTMQDARAKTSGSPGSFASFETASQTSGDFTKSGAWVRSDGMTGATDRTETDGGGWVLGAPSKSWPIQSRRFTASARSRLIAPGRDNDTMQKPWLRAPPYRFVLVCPFWLMERLRRRPLRHNSTNPPSAFFHLAR